MRILVTIAAVLLSGVASTVSAQDAADTIVFQLENFGPLGSPAEVQKTWQAAREALKDRAGVIVVPARVWPTLKAGSLQSLIRIPDPPAETKTWRQGSGLTVLTADRERPVLHVPPMAGVKLERELRMNDGDSVPHWGTHPMLTLESRLVYGSVSYLDWLQAATEKGTDRRFYVPTVRGLVPGQFLNVHGGPGYGGGGTRACIKSLGYDKEKGLHYFVADTSLDHIPGGIAQNKSNTGLIHMTQTSHADNQTYDVKVIRNQYAHGDTYIYYCDFNYMSNIHSAAGDENGNCYAAFIRSLDNNFRGTVKQWTGTGWYQSLRQFHIGSFLKKKAGGRSVLRYTSGPLLNSIRLSELESISDAGHLDKVISNVPLDSVITSATSPEASDWNTAISDRHHWQTLTALDERLPGSVKPDISELVRQVRQSQGLLTLLMSEGVPFERPSTFEQHYKDWLTGLLRFVRITGL